jgi:hypothetical protein
LIEADLRGKNDKTLIGEILGDRPIYPNPEDASKERNSLERLPKIISGLLLRLNMEKIAIPIKGVYNN